MKTKHYSIAPMDANDRMNIKPIICYPIDNLKKKNLSILHNVRKNLKNISEIIILPRDAKTFKVKKGQFFRIESIEGPKVVDPYTSKLLSNTDYHCCCHSNVTRALVNEKGIKLDEAEKLVHDILNVLNVFMCTGFTNDTKQYFMKSSLVRPGDYLEFFAETDLLGVLSACPEGDYGSKHSSDNVKCHSLKVSIWSVPKNPLKDLTTSDISGYSRSHGLG